VNRRKLRTLHRTRGFTLVEVLVALVVVVIGLAALMIAVSGTARTSGYLRDKTLAQWMALNRLSEVRLNLNKFGQNTDTGEINFANRTWHYDTRYYDTSITSMKRVVVRVYAGDAKAKGNPIAESTGFLGSSLATPGGSNVDWNPVSTAAIGPATTNGTLTNPSGTTPSPSGTTTTTNPNTTTTTTPAPTTPVTPVTPTP
jgi:general secretion pathway protein I